MVITLEEVKEILGIETGDYDTKITAKLPIIDAKFRDITGYRPNCMYLNFEKDSDIAVLLNYNHYPKIGDKLGVYGYISDNYINGVQIGSVVYSDRVKISQVATETKKNIFISVDGNISYDDVLARGVWWLVSKDQKTVTSNDWKSRNIEGISVTRDGSNKIDNKSGMPEWFISGLPKFVEAL